MRIILVLTLSSIVLLLGAACGSVVINEVELNPPGDENGRKAPARAWVELYSDDKDENIGGWSLNTSHGRSVVLPKDTIIRVLDYYIIVIEPQWLTYSEALVLNNETGAEMDRTPGLSDDGDDEMAWTRDPDGRDTDSADDWKFMPSSSGF